MKALAVLLILALGLGGCAGSSTVTPAPATSDFSPLQISGPIPFVDGLTDGTPVATSGAGSVLPLFDIPSIPTNYGTLHLLAWGTKDTAGNIGSVLELAVTGFGTPPDIAYAFFDSSGRVASIRDNATALSVELSYDSVAQVTATLCDSNLIALGHVTVIAGPGGSPEGQPVDGGTCRLTNAFSIGRSASATPAASSAPTDVGGLAKLSQLITAGAYVAGMAFAVGAIVKFKAHKDNPTQVPLSSAIAMLFVAAGLIFTPAAFNSVGGTIFGDGATVAGAEGLPPFMAPPPH